MGLLPGYRGQGLGKAVLEKALFEAFQNSLERIDLEVFASNRAPIRLYEHIGFQEEGRKRNARKLEGRYEDVVLFRLLKLDQMKDS
ncbi:MAG: hypothetical protein C1941_02810 [Prosthecochloris sp.]|nr:hypothetical protein [Prosthecochloris sp.]